MLYTAGSHCNASSYSRRSLCLVVVVVNGALSTESMSIAIRYLPATWGAHQPIYSTFYSITFSSLPPPFSH